MLVRVADDEVYSGQGRQFFRSALRVASGDNNSGVGILPAHSANRGARILIRTVGHRAGVQDDDGGPSGRGSTNQPALLELAFQGGAIGLRGTTAKVFYKESGHTLWYRIAEIPRPGRKKSSRSLRSPRLETLSTEDRTALCRAEWDSRLLPASRAGSLGLNLGVTVVLSRNWRRPQHCDPLGFASLTTFGFVLELFVVKKQLFPGGENKVNPTVGTLQHLVLKFH